jgi:hypothetical protein
LHALLAVLAVLVVILAVISVRTVLAMLGSVVMVTLLVVFENDKTRKQISPTEKTGALLVHIISKHVIKRLQNNDTKMCIPTECIIKPVVCISSNA